MADDDLMVRLYTLLKMPGDLWTDVDVMDQMRRHKYAFTDRSHLMASTPDMRAPF